MPYGSYAHKQQYRNAAGRLTAQTGRIPDFCRHSGLPGQNKKTLCLITHSFLFWMQKKK